MSPTRIIPYPASFENYELVIKLYIPRKKQTNYHQNQRLVWKQLIKFDANQTFKHVQITFFQSFTCLKTGYDIYSS